MVVVVFGPSLSLQLVSKFSGKEKAHKHKQIFPVTAPVGGGGLPTGWPGVSRPGGQGSKVYVLCAEPKEHKHFRLGTRPGGSGTRPGGSVTGVTEKLFMCQLFMCLFRPSKFWRPSVNLQIVQHDSRQPTFRRLFQGEYA